ncbi:MAG: hypothetical protein IIA61_07270 [Candidatus Marinimicrobia bacterium]|nr:hypothetical protein [Candidatus Neomarinimicrobiota bacterium]
MAKVSLVVLIVMGAWNCAPPPLSQEFIPPLHLESPVIIIPGAMGTQLMDPQTGKVVWGKILDLKAMNPHEALINPQVDGLEFPIDARPIHENRDRLVPISELTSFQMINRILEVKVYRKLFKSLSSCGLKEGNIRQCSIDANLFFFPYDWKRDPVESAILLGERIDEIKRVYKNPGLKVTLIAHSMGGMIAKYYLMYGKKDVITNVSELDQLPEPDYSGARNVDKVFFLGTPHQGSAHAFKALHEGEYLMPFVSASSWATFTMPAIYEMLPLDSKSLFVDPLGNPVALDVFDIETWTQYGIGIFSESEWESFERECAILFPNRSPDLAHEKWLDFRDFVQAALERGKRFQYAVAKMNWGKMETEYYIVAGKCNPTLSAIEFRVLESGKAEIRAVKRKLLRERYYFTDKGDYTVLYRDQLSEIDSASGVLIGCFAHWKMPSYPDVQQMIIENLRTRR